METVAIEQKQEVCLDGLVHYELNSGILPIVDIGMYESILSPNIWDDDALENLHGEYGDAGHDLACLGDFDTEEYEKKVVSAAMGVIEDYAMLILEQYGVAAIKNGRVWSPKYYNFETDNLDFTVYLTDDFMDKFHENMKRFRTNPFLQKYIEDHWWSRSGFSSFMPQSMDEIEDFDSDPVRCLACYLTFALLTEGYYSNFEDGRTILEIHYRVNDDFPVGCCHAYLYCSEEWARVYNDNAKMDELYWDAFHALGHPWNKHKQEDYNLCSTIKNEAQQLVVWATDKGYSPQDLREMCA